MSSTPEGISPHDPAPDEVRTRTPASVRQTGLHPYQQRVKINAVRNLHATPNNTSDPRAIKQMAYRLGSLVPCAEHRARAERHLRGVATAEARRWAAGSRVPRSRVDLAITRSFDAGMADPMTVPVGENLPLGLTDEQLLQWRLTALSATTCGSCRKIIDGITTAVQALPQGPQSWLGMSQRQVGQAAGMPYKTVQRHEMHLRAYSRAVRTKEDTVATAATPITLHGVAVETEFRGDTFDPDLLLFPRELLNGVESIPFRLLDPRSDRWSGDRCRRYVWAACTRLTLVSPAAVRAEMGDTAPSKRTLQEALKMFVQWGWLRRLSDGSLQHLSLIHI